MARISTHNGTEVNRSHNIREEKVVSKESHITPNGHFEIWHDEEIRDAYERLFGRYVDEYNEKQKRKDRKIKDYYDEVKKSSQQNPVYEIIVGVYGDEVDEQDRYDILKKYYKDWERRNPNLEIVGAYYHNDEEGEPHLHIDYVPIGHGFQKGMSVKNSLRKAMEEMGYVKVQQNRDKEFSFENKHNVNQWTETENKYLESLCEEYGIVVEHNRDEERHLKTKVYKLLKQVEDLEEEISIRQSKIIEMENKFNSLSSEIDTYTDAIDIFGDVDTFTEELPFPYDDETAVEYRERIKEYNEEMFAYFYKIMESKSEYLQSLEKQKNELDEMRKTLKRHDFTFDEVANMLDRCSKIKKASLVSKKDYEMYQTLEKRLYFKGRDMERFSKAI